MGCGMPWTYGCGGASDALPSRRVKACHPRAGGDGAVSVAQAQAVEDDPAILAVDDLHVEFDTYGGIVKAVRGVSFNVRAGKTLAIVGESGCGKSVTVQSIMGLIPMPPGRITRGTALLEGVDIIKQRIINGQDIRGDRLGMIFQDPMSSLNPTMRVGDQIAETLHVHRGYTRKQAFARAVDLLGETHIPEPGKRARQYPFAFSGGMLQRAMIAMAIACEPSILIADEPTTAIDVTTQAQILDLLLELQSKTGMAIVLITHNLGVVARMADDVAVMYAGEMVEKGSADDIFYRASHPYTLGLQGAMPSNDPEREAGPPAHRRDSARHVRASHRLCLLRALPLCDATLRREPSSEVPAQSTPLCQLLAPPRKCPAGDRSATLPQRDVVSALLEARNVTKYFDIGRKQVVHAVDDVSLDVHEREIVGLVGESGSGKSTFGKALLGLHDKTGGEVYFKGEKLPPRYTSADFQRYASRMQMIFQDPYSSLDPRMTVGEIIGEGLRLHSETGTIAARERISEWLRRVGLEPDHASRYPHEFSGGQRQRVGIARALIMEPEFVVCDEPISALDVSVQAQVVRLLGELKSSLGLTMLFIAHDLSMVRYVSDRMAVMYQGSLVEVGAADDVFFRPKHPYTEVLIGSNPLPDPKRERQRRRISIKGEIASPINIGEGCRYADRCAEAMDVCRSTTPELHAVTDATGERLVACHLYD